MAEGAEEMVRQSKRRGAVEGKHGGIFGIVDGRRRGFGLSSGTGVHSLHRGDLNNDRAGVSVTGSEDTIRVMEKCIMSAGREREDESARREWAAFKGHVQGTRSKS
jgi:hypothetical protein